MNFITVLIMLHAAMEFWGANSSQTHVNVNWLTVIFVSELFLHAQVQQSILQLCMFKIPCCIPVDTQDINKGVILVPQCFVTVHWKLKVLLITHFAGKTFVGKIFLE